MPGQGQDGVACSAFQGDCHLAQDYGPQACPRGLRHLFGVAAVSAGVPLPTIATVLGPASLTKTAIDTTVIGAEARDLVSRVRA